MRRAVSIVIGAAIALVVGCSDDSSHATEVDAGMLDASMRDAASPSCDGASCARAEGGGELCRLGCCPIDASTFQPSPYRAANPHRLACTPQQIDAFYAACIGPQGTKAACDALRGATASASDKACAACFLTDITAPTYGALLLSVGMVEANVAGCIELLDSPGALPCAKARQALDECRRVACGYPCTPIDEIAIQLYLECQQQSETHECQAFASAAKCVDAEADGGAAAVCVRGQTFEELYRGVVPVFCGVMIDGGSSTDASSD